MNLNSRKSAVFFSTVILVLGLFVSLTAVSAQTRKKPRRKTNRTLVAPAPVTQPTVISQAEQYQNQNQQIITGDTTEPSTQLVETQPAAQPETFDEKLDKITRRLDEMSSNGNSRSSRKNNEYDEKQKRLALNLDILSKAEQRTESLRKQLFEIVEKENNLREKLETIDYDSRPEMIDRQVAFTGSLRPEELREMRRKKLDAEKRNIENLLIEIQSTRANLELNVQKADTLVEKLRAKLEKDIDDALVDEPKP